MAERLECLSPEKPSGPPDAGGGKEPPHGLRASSASGPQDHPARGAAPVPPETQPHRRGLGGVAIAVFLAAFAVLFVWNVWLTSQNLSVRRMQAESGLLDELPGGRTGPGDAPQGAVDARPPSGGGLAEATGLPGLSGGQPGSPAPAGGGLAEATGLPGLSGQPGSPAPAGGGRSDSAGIPGLSVPPGSPAPAGNAGTAGTAGQGAGLSGATGSGTGSDSGPPPAAGARRPVADYAIPAGTFGMPASGLTELSPPEHRWCAREKVRGDLLARFAQVGSYPSAAIEADTQFRVRCSVAEERDPPSLSDLLEPDRRLGVKVAREVLDEAWAANPRLIMREPDPAALPPGMSLAPTLAEAQDILRAIGLDPGPEDGGDRRATASAIKAFQKDLGLPETGELDRRTGSLLRSAVFHNSLVPFRE